MTKLIAATAATALFIAGASAQDAPIRNQVRFQPSAVMGKAIKGAPYSADEITDSLQVLGDGTRIARHSQVTVYRDGEGRVRRETPTQITILDPVANVNYSLDPKTMTATKLPMARTTYSYTATQAPGKVFTFTGATASTSTIATTGSSQDIVAVKAEADARGQQAAADLLKKLQAELAASGNGNMVVDGNTASAQTAADLKKKLAEAADRLAKSEAEASSSAKMESLGQQVMEGLTADGTRITETLEAGAIGNDRPIQTVSERWYSADLQTPVMTKRTDPRTGEETFRLANVRRGEPGADLFLLPPGYQLIEPKTQPAPTRKEE